MQSLAKTISEDEHSSSGSAALSVAELNVGGQLYTTSISTLTRNSDSLLAAMFSGRQKVLRDSRGRFFIDRDGVLFRFILDYLRNNRCVLPDGFSETDRLLIEAEYFQLKGLVKTLRTIQASNSTTDLAASHEIAKRNGLRPNGGYINLSVRGTFAFGRDGLADIKFRKLQRILVCGNVALARKAFGDSLNETRDPDRDSERYTSRFYLKHNHLEKAFDQLNVAGFHLVTSCAGGAGYDHDSEETKWNHFNDYVFYRDH